MENKKDVSAQLARTTLSSVAARFDGIEFGSKAADEAALKIASDLFEASPEIAKAEKFRLDLICKSLIPIYKAFSQAEENFVRDGNADTFFAVDPVKKKRITSEVSVMPGKPKTERDGKQYFEDIGVKTVKNRASCTITTTFPSVEAFDLAKDQGAPPVIPAEFDRQTAAGIIPEKYTTVTTPMLYSNKVTIEPIEPEVQE